MCDPIDEILVRFGVANPVHQKMVRCLLSGNAPDTPKHPDDAIIDLAKQAKKLNKKYPPVPF